MQYKTNYPQLLTIQQNTHMDDVYQTFCVLTNLREEFCHSVPALFTEVESFSNVSRWLDEIDQHGSMEQGARGARDPNHFRGVLLGNKTDLREEFGHSVADSVWAVLRRHAYRSRILSDIRAQNVNPDTRFGSFQMLRAEAQCGIPLWALHEVSVQSEVLMFP